MSSEYDGEKITNLDVDDCLLLQSYYGLLMGDYEKLVQFSITRNIPLVLAYSWCKDAKAQLARKVIQLQAQARVSA